jgi:hypothetical protein
MALRYALLLSAADCLEVEARRSAPGGEHPEPQVFATVMTSADALRSTARMWHDRARAQITLEGSGAVVGRLLDVGRHFDAGGALSLQAVGGARDGARRRAIGDLSSAAAPALRPLASAHGCTHLPTSACSHGRSCAACARDAGCKDGAR